AVPTESNLSTASGRLPSGVMLMSLPHASPAEIGLEPRRLQVAYDRLTEWTGGNNPQVPAGAILVGRNGKVVAPRVFGRQGPEADAHPIRPDAIFLLASITKPIVYMGALM